MKNREISTVELSVSNYSYNMKILVVAIIAFSEALGSHQGYAPSTQYHGPIALSPGYDKNGAPLPVQDTPEVAHAKSVQLSLIAKAGGDIYPSVHHSGIESGSYEGSSWSVPQTQQYSGAEHIRYHGPIAHSPGYDKYGAPLPVLETPEVAHLKAKHSHNFAKTLSNLIAKGLYEPDYTAQKEHHQSSYEGSSWSAPQTQQNSGAEHIRYHGPIAHSPGYDKYGAPLPVVETPEVAHLKAEHSHNFAKTLSNLIAKGLYEPDYTAQKEHHQSSYEGSSLSAPQTQKNSGADHIRYHGPIAHSPGYDKYGAPLPVLETPEVAHLKAEHSHNFAKTLSNLIAKGLYEPDYTAQKEHSHHNSW